ncbi:MATE family efflux transporter [Brevibacillus migulae]|uniref:MATE family efflux transporter n=1 Tax=Brevibacillus migulae TaxID=1644114 RepID=UPI00106E1391|nr:MATE family efflux transporter [Brevibacillus migulae]
MSHPEVEKKELGEKLTLFSLSWPILVEFFLMMLMGMADTFMLAHVSDDAVAAVGLSNQIISMAIVMFNFVAIGSAVVVAQYLGAKRVNEVGQISAASITLNFLWGLVISLVFILFSTQLLSLMDVPTQLLGDASHYLAIVGSTLFFQAILSTASAIIRANGYTRDAMLVSIGMNVIHVVGNYLFIFGAWGVPQLGVTGVAISTVISRGLATVVMMVLLYRRVPVKIEWVDYIKWKAAHLRNILKIGIPSAGEHLSYESSQIMCTAFIATLGASALATKIYTQNIMYFVLLFSLAIGQGTEILVGHLIGAGKIKEAYKQLIRSLQVSFTVTIVVVLAVALLREPLIGIFTDNSAIIQLGGILLLSCIVLEPGRTFNLVVINSLRAAGDAQFPVVMGILSMWGISVPVSYLLGIHFEMGLLGFWIAFAIDEWVRGVMMYIRWRSRAWEKKALVKPAVHVADV